MGDEGDEDMPVAVREAATWRVTLAEQGVRSSDSFRRWLAADPAHLAAWRRLDALWSDLDAAADHLRARRWRRAALRRGSSGLPLAAAAVLTGLAAAILASLLAHGASRPDQTISTDRNQRRIVSLGDGSRLTLDGGTVVEVRLTPRRRDLELVRGQGRFDVARDPARPFRVHAGGQTITALGTSFMVDRGAEGTAVTLLKGEVTVTGAPRAWRAPLGPPPVILRPGQQVLMAAGLVVPPRVTRVSLDRARAWEAGQLVFDDEPLGFAVERVSRYSARPISVADPAVAGLRISGVFKAGDDATFVEAVTAYFPLAAVAGPDGEVILRRRGGNIP